MHPYPSRAVGVRNTTPSLAKQLRGLERTVFVARKLVPALNPITGKMEVRPAMTGETLNLGKRRAERRAFRRAAGQFRKLAGSAKTRNRLTLDPPAMGG